MGAGELVCPSYRIDNTILGSWGPIRCNSTPGVQPETNKQPNPCGPAQAGPPVGEPINH